MVELKSLLGRGFEEEFSKFNNFNKAGFILRCENWDKYDFKAFIKTG